MAVCIPNISYKERRKRLVGGVVQAAAALVATCVLMFSKARWWRLAVFPVWYGSAAGFFQWRENT